LVDLSATIRCYFPNYIYYKWQKSTNGGVSWFDTGVSGVGSPTMVSGQWEYTAVYPQFIAWQADSGHRYRTVVATTLSNLSNANCSYSNNTNTFLNIIDCGIILNVNLKEFKGQLVQNNADINWTLVSGNNIKHFELEKSYDGTNFTQTAIVPFRYEGGISSYDFTDPEKTAGISFYRLRIVDQNGLFIYSPIITVSNKKIDFEIRALTNPVSSSLALDYILPADGRVNIRLLDMFGNLVKQQSVTGRKGWNNTRVEMGNGMAEGIYILSVLYNNATINKRIVKIN